MTKFRRFVSSLLGHIVVFEIVCSLPLFLVFLVTNYSEWTVEWAIYSALVCAVAGAVAGAVFWTLTSAFRKRKGQA